SKSRTTTALMCPSSASMRAIAWSTSSTAETWRAASAATSSVVVRYVIFPSPLWLLASTDQSCTRASGIDVIPAPRLLRPPEYGRPDSGPVPTLPYPAAPVQAGRSHCAGSAERVGWSLAEVLPRGRHQKTVSQFSDRLHNVMGNHGDAAEA